jgi:hypothetical protein
MMVNDHPQKADGTLALSLESERGGGIARSEKPFSIPPNGQETYVLRLQIPAATGRHVLKATALPSGGVQASPTISRRNVTLVRK